VGKHPQSASTTSLCSPSNQPILQLSKRLTWGNRNSHSLPRAVTGRVHACHYLHSKPQQNQCATTTTKRIQLNCSPYWIPTSVGRRVVRIGVLLEYPPAKTTRVPTRHYLKIWVPTWAVLARVLGYSDTSTSDVIVLIRRKLLLVRLYLFNWLVLKVSLCAGILEIAPNLAIFSDPLSLNALSQITAKHEVQVRPIR
jgi:hypothetical protein